MKKTLRTVTALSLAAVLLWTGVRFAGAETRTMVVSVSSGTLNLRDGPSVKGRVLGGLVNGTPVTVVTLQNGWAAVMADGKSGYVDASYLSTSSAQKKETEKGWRSIGQKMLVNCGSLHLRAEPSASSGSLGLIKKGTPVNVTAGNGTWYKVKVNGKDGYMMSRYLSDDSRVTVLPDTMYVSADRVNLREEASTGSGVIAVLSVGARLTVLSGNGEWIRVSCGGKKGYISRDYVTETQPAVSKGVATVSNPYASYVNLRSAAKKDNGENVLAYVKNGASVTVLSRGSTWTKVMYSDFTGYMLTSMLTFIK